MAGSSRVVTVLIPLPLTYNPDAKGRRRRIEERKFTQTMQEIAKRFGGGVLWRFPNDPPDGFWWHKGHLYKDVLAAIEIDIPDTTEAKTWLRWYAQTVLLQRFRQEAIYLKFVGPVETIEVTAVKTE
jgi:hypothetical protein